MSPLPAPTMTERVMNLLSLPRQRIRAIFPSGTPRWLWLLFQLAALGLAGVGTYYAWREFPQGLHVEPTAFALTGAIYVLAFSMHLLGWQSLARIFFGQMRPVEHVEAIAGSNLVKYLPTIAWYIANRSHYYHAREVASKSVVIASLSELALMIGSGGVMLVALWIGQVLSPLLAVVICLAGFTVMIWLLARHAGNGDHKHPGHWVLALLWYGGSWPMGALMLWAILRAFVPVGAPDLPTVADIWLLAGLASYATSLTLGAFGIAREITLTVLVAQHWPLSVGIAAAIVVKLVLTLGEIGCSLAILGWINLRRRLAVGTPKRDIL
ncbi:hypothetical protein EKD04_005815 [Chloroflexales bacterium ZM16-3]|nr:hypothetical protein [Chloroflexales bacterium ZM16-3]